MPGIRESDIRKVQMMFAACMLGDLQGIITLLNEHIHDIDGNNIFGIDIDPQGWGRRPIHAATISGYFEIFKFLIDNGADVNIKTKYGDTALHFAVYHNRLRFLKLLLEKKANPLLENNSHKTPFDVAKEQNKSDYLAELEKYEKNFYQTTNEKVLKKLLEKNK